MKKVLVCLLFLFTCQVYAGLEYSKETVFISMRDSVRLATDIYRQVTSNPKPVLLQRTPYNKNSGGLDESMQNILSSLGLIYVVQDTRGRYASEGTDSVFVTDGWGALQDGYDTIDWIAQQSWCNGKVAMMGASASGITTYRAAAALHPNLVAAVAIVSASDFYHQVVFPGGAFRKQLCEGWVSGQGSDYMISYFKSMPYYDEFWEYMNLHTRTAHMRVPILHITGWYDCFLDGSFAAFSDLTEQENAGAQKIIIGPWTHDVSNQNQVYGDLDFPNSNYDLFTPMLFWLGNYLVVPNGAESMPNVTYYLMGDPAAVDEPGCEWIQADTWPPATRAKKVNLSPLGQITHYMVGPDSLSFTYDPNDPVPTFGGNNLFNPAGWQAAPDGLDERPDVLSFETHLLTEPLRIEGTITAELLVSSNALDTDFTLMILDVYPDGREILITDAVRCTRFRNGYTEKDVALMQPGEKYHIKIKTPPTATVFNTGHKVKVLVSSSNYPRFEINPNTGAEPTNIENKRIAVNTLHWTRDDGCTITFPVVSGQVQVEHEITIPETFQVRQNYPNPFNPCTTISYELPDRGRVTVDIYNALGKHIYRVLDDEQNAGMHRVIWNGMQSRGVAGSGIYYYKVQFNNHSIVKKMLLVR